MPGLGRCAVSPELLPTDRVVLPVHVYDEALFAPCVAARIATILRGVLSAQRQATVIVSAGRTPTATYRALREHREAVDFSRVRLVQMDEYAGLPPGDESSLAAYLQGEVAEPLGIGEFATFHDAHGLPARTLRAHEALALSADLVVHGIGRNGHLGFNEPPSGPAEASRRVWLDPRTCRDNGMAAQRLRAVTLGTAVLLTARHTLLLARGAAKAAAVAGAVQGPMSRRCPASWLQSVSGCSVHLDPPAASALHVLPLTG